MSKNASVKKNDAGKAKSQTKPKSTTPSTKQAPVGVILQRALSVPEGLSAQDVLQLQGVIGNQNVGRILQRAPIEKPNGHHGRLAHAPLVPRERLQRQPNPIVYNPSFRLHQAPVNYSVQRMVTSDQFKQLAGAPSGKAKFNKSTYTKILHKLDKFHLYREKGDRGKQEEKLKDLIKLIDSWTKSHTNKEGRLKDSSDQRKHTFFASLKLEAEAELGLRTDPLPQNDDMPTQAIERLGRIAQMGAELEESTKKELLENSKLEDEEKNRYVFSVFVDIVNVDDREYIAKRTQLSIENEKQKYLNKKRRKKNEVRIKTSKEIKNETAQYVVDSKYQYDTNKMLDRNKRDQHIKDLVANAGTSGHTWVKLSVFNSENELVSENSAGFWPLAGTMGIRNSVPGIIQSPDPVPENYQMESEDELGDKVRKQGLRRFDTVISGSSYKQAMSYVIDKMKRPPDYNLQTYNCTTFAKEVADKAGAPLPEKSYLAVPGGVTDVALGINSVRLYSPDELYYALGNKADHFHNTHITKSPDNTLGDKEDQWLLDLEDLSIYLFGTWISPNFMTERNSSARVDGRSAVDYMVENNCGVGEIFDVMDESWDGEDNSLVVSAIDGETYIVQNSALKAFKQEVKSKLKEREEFRELAQKSSVYVPVPLLKLNGNYKEESVLTTETETTTQPIKKEITEMEARQLFQEHFSTNRYGNLTLKTEVPLYSEGDDLPYMAQPGTEIKATMLYGDKITVEDWTNQLYMADPRALAVALGWG